MPLPERKRMILKAIVENYIDTAEPVGSKALAVSFHQSISSATIRNEMSELEDMGFLEKPHISAGRVPSYAAYRFYVNELMGRYRVANEELDIIRRQMQQKMLEIDNILVSASKVVSNLTNQTAVSIARQAEGVKVKKCEIISMGEGASYAVVLVLPDAVKSKVIPLSSPLDPAAASVLATAVNLAIAENRLDFLLPSMAQSAGMNASVYELTRRVVEFIIQTENAVDPPEVHLEGVSKLLENREYQDTDKARELLKHISDHQWLQEVFDPDNDTSLVNIRIGPELEDPGMRDVSFVYSTYKIDAATQGIIGVIAPTRMDYATAYAKLSAFIQAVESGDEKLQKELGEHDGRT